MSYAKFLEDKRRMDRPVGIKDGYTLNPMLFPFQQDCVRFALRRGRAGLFEDCGLGKTFQQLEWARVVAEQTKGFVLILAPLAVAQQTIEEAKKLGIEIGYVRKQEDIRTKIVITNYEMLHHFDARAFAGVVLDESSILKNFTGKTRNAIIEAFADTRFKLSCTATPAPNDYMELGNQAEFLGVMTRAEMLAMYFVHDGGETSQWRLKGHAEEPFWRWMCTWAVCLQKPSDIGHSDVGYELPALTIHKHVFEAKITEGFLLAMPAETLTTQRQAKREGLRQRVETCARMANTLKEPWVCWGELNDECNELEKLIPDCVQVAGCDTVEQKESRLLGFAAGKSRVMVSKSSIAGFGLNWQHCWNMAFVNLSHSFEDQYQAIRRCWRFGQTHPVNVHLFLLESEIAILENVERKQREADAMAANMIQFMKSAMQDEMGALVRDQTHYTPKQKVTLPTWMQSTKSTEKDGLFTTATASKSSKKSRATK